MASPMRALGEVCEIVNGGTPKTAVEEYWGGERRWITPAEMGKRATPYVSETQRQLTDAGLRDSSARLIPPYSVIMSTRAPIGHLVINTEPMAFNQGCKGFVPGKSLDHKYLYYHLLANVPVLDSLGTGATFKELPAGRLRDFGIPLPTLVEQKRIVGILDDAFAAIDKAKANTERNIENTRALAGRAVERAFSAAGGASTRLSEIALFRNGINFTKASKGHQVKIVGVSDFANNFWAPTDSLGSVIANGNLGENDLLNEGDILFCRSNGNIQLVGRSLLVGPIDERITHSGFTIRARLDTSKAVPRFVAHFVRTEQIRSQMVAGGIGTNIKSLNQGTLASLSVPLPSTAVQEKVVDRIEQILASTNDLQTIVNGKLASLERLKASIISGAFAGDL